ncbi:MAG TPA: HAD family hydrolase [Thermoanaerobaculia bacterium]|nr:HAD family hydrolase [Thermoanaerobaculia bacterium]
MNLVLFDVDGTLTQTVGVDEDCFARAFADAFGLGGVDCRCGLYEHCTDSWICREVLRRAWSRLPTEAEIECHRRRFLDLLAEAHGEDPRRYAAMPGAARLLAALRADPAWKVALATGCWRASAVFKLDAAGLEAAELPLAAADDAFSREEILAAAVARAAACYGQPAFARIVAVGDGAWDVMAARRLGLPFVGVATGERAERLHHAGAGLVLRDFSDLELTLCGLLGALPPVAEESHASSR